MSRWEVIEAPLEDDDIVNTLEERLPGIAFEGVVGDSIYCVDIERNSNNSIIMTMSDGTKFELICSKGE